MSKEETIAKLWDIAVNTTAAMVLSVLSGRSAKKLENGQDYREYIDEETAEALRYVLDALEGRAVIDDPAYIERHIEMLDERMETLSAYIVEALSADEVIGLYYNERIARDIDLPVSAHRLLNEMAFYIMGDDDQDQDDGDDQDRDAIEDDDIEGRIQDVLSLVPMPWNKQRFYEYVKDALKWQFDYMDKEQIDEAIQRLKEAFTGRLEPNYGVFFTEIAREIDELQQLKPLKLSDQEIIDAANRVLALINELQDRMSFYTLVREGLRVLKNAHKADIELSSTWGEVAGLVDKLLQLTPSTVDSEYVDQLEDRITSMVSETITDLPIDESYYEEELKDLLEGIEDVPEDITSQLNDIMMQPVKYAAMVDWDELWSEEPADEEYAEAKIQEFIDFMDKAMADMPSMYRRARMKAVMQGLPLNFDEPEDAIDYIHEALEFMPSDGVLRFIEARFHNMMDSQQDDEQDYDEDDEE
jgi:predicted house-cleaning noncanonical NTP pyrophosphatase (MazG superfamily)